MLYIINESEVDKKIRQLQNENTEFKKIIQKLQKVDVKNFSEFKD